jgi:hypothetical protein
MMRIGESQRLRGDSYAGKLRSNKIESAALATTGHCGPVVARLAREVNDLVY